MKKVFIVILCDNWHSQASQQIASVCDSLEIAIKHIKTLAKEENCKISKDDLYNLQHIKQTQGYEGTGEFLIKEMEINKI